MPVDSGEGNLPILSGDQSPPTEAEGILAFARSSLTARSPNSTLPTTDMLEKVHEFVATGALDLVTCVGSVGSTPEEASTVQGGRAPDNLPSVSETSQRRISLPTSERRRLTKERKVAKGTWLSWNEWRRSKGLPKRKRHEGTPSPKQETGTGMSPLLRDTAPGAPQLPNKRARTRWVVPPGQAAPVVASVAPATDDLTFKDQLKRFKMAVAPVSYPDSRFTDEVCNAVKQKLVELVFGSEDSGLHPQILKTYEEKGALVVTCGNAETKEWLEGTASDLGSVCALRRGGVTVGDYKDLLRSTKVLLRTDRTLAGMEANRIFKLIDIQNPGFSIKGWRIIGGKREEESQTFALAIDESNALVLMSWGWKVFLGLSRVQLRVLSGASADDAGEPST